MIIEKAQAAFDLGFLATIAGRQKEGSADSINKIFGHAIDVVLWVAGALAIIYIIYSGILYITSAGNPDSAKKGQQGLVNGVIGLIVVVLSYYMATAIAEYAGSKLGNQDPVVAPGTPPAPIVPPGPEL